MSTMKAVRIHQQGSTGVLQCSHETSSRVRRDRPYTWQNCFRLLGLISYVVKNNYADKHITEIF